MTGQLALDDTGHDAPLEPPTVLDVRAVPCPSCGALTGRACKRPSGHRAMIAHAPRIAAARWAAGMADEAAPTLDTLTEGAN